MLWSRIFSEFRRRLESEREKEELDAMFKNVINLYESSLKRVKSNRRSDVAQQNKSVFSKDQEVL